MGAAEQGATQDRYSVIPRVLVFLFRDQKVLLIKGAATKRIWANLWNGVGGHVEAGESILNAARRELLEETGLFCADLTFCGQVMVDVGENPGIGIHVFKGEQLSGDLKHSAEGEIAWIPLEDTKHLEMVRDLFVLIPKVEVFKAGDLPFFGVYSYNAADEWVISFD